MGLKILHSADWHLDSPFGGFPPEQRMALRKAQSSIPQKLGQLIRQEGCDLVLLAGDLFDGIPGRETVERLRRTLESYAVPVFISPGNHDFCGPGSPWLEESWPENVHIFRGDLESMVLPELDCRIYGAGYRSMDCGPLLEGFRAEGPERYCIGLLHGDPTVKRSPCCPVTAAQVRQSGLDYLALGHIHRAGAFTAGDTLCGWPGCPMGRGWDETGEKGVYLVTLADGARIEPVLLDLPRFYELTADVGRDALQTLEELLPAAGSDDHYRVTLTGWGTAEPERLKAQLARFPNLELRDQTRPAPELWAQAGEDSLRGVYFRLLQEKARQDPAARLAAEISAKLLMDQEVTLP